MAPSAPGAASSLAAKARRSFCEKPAAASEASRQAKHNFHSCNVSRCGVCEANRLLEQKQANRQQEQKQRRKASGHAGATTTIAASPRLLSRLKAVSPMKEKRPVGGFATIHTYADLSGEAQASEAASAPRVVPPPALELLGAADDSALDPASPKGDSLQASPTSNELTESALLRSEELLRQFSNMDLDGDCSGTDDLEKKGKVESFETTVPDQSGGSSPSHGGSEGSLMSDYGFAMPKFSKAVSVKNTFIHFQDEAPFVALRRSKSLPARLESE